MEELKEVLKRNGVYHLYGTLRDNGIYNLQMFTQLSKRDIEILGIDEYIDKLRLNRILDEVQKEEKLSTDLQEDLTSQKILVVVRKRPPVHKEDDAVDVQGLTVVVNEHKFRLDLEPYTERHSFSFDMAYDQFKNNPMVYTRGVKEIVNHVARGGSGSIIAYGQTGSGKTYTMMEEKTGMVVLALKDLLAVKNRGQVVFCEIYLGQVYDLLNNRSKIVLREVGGVVHLTSIKSLKFESFDDVSRIIKDGLRIRKTGVTGANVKSSRSHAVIMVSFGQNKTDTFGDSNSIVFVDLAGSERGTDRQGSHNDIKNEGAEINKSLLALKECIRGIEKDLKHLPFRQSKLTQILKNSFVGTSKTCIIATISPSYENVEHTLNTLRYASRIKETQKGESPRRPPTACKNLKLSISNPNNLSQNLSQNLSNPNLNSSGLFSSSHSYADKFINSPSQDFKPSCKSSCKSSFNFRKEAKKLLEFLNDKIDEGDEDQAREIYEKLKELQNKY